MLKAEYIQMYIMLFTYETAYRSVVFIRTKQQNNQDANIAKARASMDSKPNIQFPLMHTLILRCLPGLTTCL